MFQQRSVRRSALVALSFAAVLLVSAFAAIASAETAFSEKIEVEEAEAANAETGSMAESQGCQSRPRFDPNQQEDARTARQSSDGAVPADSTARIGVDVRAKSRRSLLSWAKKMSSRSLGSRTGSNASSNSNSNSNASSNSNSGSGSTDSNDSVASYVRFDDIVFPDLSCIAQGGRADDPVHVVVIVHGLMGSHMELDYLRERMAAYYQQKPVDGTNECILFHAAQSNGGKTTDGIANGGIRLAAEINELLRRVDSHGSQDDTANAGRNQRRRRPIALSIVSFSLGGLHSRYALSRIEWDAHSIAPHRFITIASPHLGTHRYTYFSWLTESMKKFSAYGIKRTGQDLFLYTDVMVDMCKNPAFTQPLRRFDKRIAYGNAFDIDFPVPTATAVFLDDTSDDSHTLMEATDAASDQRLRSIRFRTSQKDPSVGSDSAGVDEFDTGEGGSGKCGGASSTGPGSTAGGPATSTSTKESAMASALNDMGWTKVLIDLRHEVPALLRMTAPSRKADLLDLLRSQQNEVDTQQRQFTSRQLFRAFTTRSSSSSSSTGTDPVVGSPSVLPVAHSWLVASKKNALYDYFYRGGRTVADELSRELMDEIRAK